MRDAYQQDRYMQERRLIWEFLPPYKKIAKGKHRRFYRIKKNDQARKLLPLDWHSDYQRPGWQWRKYRSNVRLVPLRVDRRLRKPDKEKIGQTFWRIHFHETVVWELKALCNQKDIFVAEAEMEEMLASPTDNPTEDWIRKNCMSKDVSQLPSVVHPLNSTTSHSSTILDTGAMMHSGDATKNGKETEDTRTPLQEHLSVVGVHGDASSVTHEFKMKIPIVLSTMKR
jgi:hypothetical protein